MARKKNFDEEWPEAWVDGKPGDWRDEKLIYEVADVETFHIGQSYENEAAVLIACTRCHGREFNVGTGSHFTAIRCVKCEWEMCIHDG